MSEELTLKQRVKVADGLENIITGLGTSKDKNSANAWLRSVPQSTEELSVRFKEDWLSQKIVTIVPQDMTRKWRRCSTPEGVKADREMGIDAIFREAYQWARLYGTSAIVLDLIGAGDVSKPLNLRRLKPNCIRSLQVVDRTRLMPTGITVTDPMDPDYGLPTHYTLGGSHVQIHKSRILRFEGVPLTRYEMMRNSWFSDSVLTALSQTIDNYHVAATAAASLVHESNCDVFSIQGLQQMLTHPQGESAVMKRFRLMKMMKSNHNAIVMDSTEEYTSKAIALSGLKDLIVEYLHIVAASVGIPATRFLSISPAGMNATGESDLNNYIDLISGAQHSVFEPRLKIIDQILCAHYGIEEFEYEWIPAFPESLQQRDERRKTLSEALSNLVTAGIMKPEVAIEIMEKEHTFCLDDLGDPPPQPKEDKPSAKAK